MNDYRRPRRHATRRGVCLARVSFLISRKKTKKQKPKKTKRKKCAARYHTIAGKFPTKGRTFVFENAKTGPAKNHSNRRFSRCCHRRINRITSNRNIERVYSVIRATDEMSMRSHCVFYVCKNVRVLRPISPDLV